jgi:rhodanese-related sulfurtransferase
MTFELTTPMQNVEMRLPFAKSLLHSKFHVGGCSKCGYEPQETLEEVATKHNKDASAMVDALNQALQDAVSAQLSCSHLASLINNENGALPPLLIDVREPWEADLCTIPNSILLSESNMDEVVKKIQAAKLTVVYCHHGVRSLNAAMYFRSLGYPEVYSLRGGIDLYSREIDSSIQRY